MMYDLMTGLSGKGVKCDMLCAACDEEDVGVDKLDEYSKLICTRTWVKVKATMLSPGMIIAMRRIRNDYILSLHARLCNWSHTV